MVTVNERVVPSQTILDNANSMVTFSRPSIVTPRKTNVPLSLLSTFFIVRTVCDSPFTVSTDFQVPTNLSSASCALISRAEDRQDMTENTIPRAEIFFMVVPSDVKIGLHLLNVRPSS